MKIKILLIGLLLLGIVLSGCVETDHADDLGNTDTSNTDTGNINPVTTGSEEEQFVKFGADISCARYEFAEAMRAIKDDPNSGEKGALLSEAYWAKIATIIENYGYDVPKPAGDETGHEPAEWAKVDEMSKKYEEDIDYAQAVVDRVKILCPAAAPELEQNIDIMKNGMSVTVIINEADNSSVIKYKYFSEGFINQGSRDSTANMEDIENTIRERFGDLAEKALEVAKYMYK